MQALLFLSVLFGIFALVLAVVIYTVLIRARDLRLLVTDGVQGQARVITVLYRNYTRREGFRGVIYEFTDPTGRTWRRNVHLNAADEPRFHQGTQVAIRYLPDRPAVNALEELVARTRQRADAASPPDA